TGAHPRAGTSVPGGSRSARDHGARPAGRGHRVARHLSAAAIRCDCRGSADTATRHGGGHGRARWHYGRQPRLRDGARRQVALAAVAGTWPWFLAAHAVISTDLLLLLAHLV